MNQELQDEINENKICSMIGQELEKYYSGWDWYVECKISTGLASVRNLDLDGDYGFYIPLMNLLNETTPRIVKMAAGEILERYNMDRTYRKQFDIEKDFTGAAIGDKNATS